MRSIAASYLALYEWLTTKVPTIGVWVGHFKFPQGGAAKWLKRQPVSFEIERCARELAAGERFFDVRIDGDAVDVVSWEWRGDHEALEQPFGHALDLAGRLGAKGKLTKVARFDDGGCTWVTYALGNKKCAVDEGETKLDGARMQKALARAGPPFRAWLDAHPDTKVRFERSGKYGYVDRSGAECIAPTFDRAYEFSDGIANVQEGRSGRLLTREGKLLPGKYFTTGYFMRGLAPVAVEQSKYGYADGKGKLRIPARFVEARPFRGPLAIVIAEKWVQRWMTPAGKLVGDPIEYTHDFTEDLAWIYSRADRCYRCIDASCEPAFDARFHATAAFSGGLAAVVEEEGGKWGYCDRRGRVVIEARFDEAHAFSEGRAAVKLDGRYRLVDERGRLLGETFDGIHAAMSEGRIAVRIKGKYGFADRDGAVVIAPKFSDAHGYFEERAYVQVKGDRWGHIDRDGHFAVPAELEWTNRYSGGLAPAKQRGLHGFIDRDGAWVVPPRYEATQPMFTDGLAWVKLP